jgi:hypothetical protein
MWSSRQRVEYRGINGQATAVQPGRLRSYQYGSARITSSALRSSATECRGAGLRGRTLLTRCPPPANGDALAAPMLTRVAGFVMGDAAPACPLGPAKALAGQ